MPSTNILGQKIILWGTSRKDGSVSIHHRDIQALAMEMYKVKSGYTPTIFSDLFNQRAKMFQLTGSSTNICSIANLVVNS